ncbi:MAG: DUF58 domain-containing protein [Actinobacteria bacterium]|nr:DUF58 domain-containing protein [Actinomycetota bacterium]
MPRIRLRRRAATLPVGALLLFLVGTNVQAGWLFVLSSLLLGATVAGVVLPPLMVRRVRVIRRAPAEAFVGERVGVDLVVENPARRPRLSVAVRDPHVAPAAAFVPWLGAGDTVTASTIRLAARRGVVEGGPVVVASSAPFGVAEARSSVPAGGGRTVIFPRVVPVAALPLLEPGVRGGEDAVPSHARGEGYDFLGVREYRRGDSLRRVHWPSTARHGSLVVREFEQDRPARLVALVDTWADAGRTDGHAETALDLCCAAAASIALAALGAGHGVALAAGRRGEVAPPAEMERRDALAFLAELEAPGGVSLAVALEAVGGAIQGPAALLLAFASWRPNSARALLPAVGRLTARGVRVAAAVVDPASLRPEAAVLSARELRELVSELATEGVDVYPIRPEEDLAACLAGEPSVVAG